MYFLEGDSSGILIDGVLGFHIKCVSGYWKLALREGNGLWEAEGIH